MTTPRRPPLFLPPPPSGMTRRGFLALVAAGATVVVAGCSGDGEPSEAGAASSTTAPSSAPDTAGTDVADLEVPELAAPFTLGVASGDPTPDAVILWTRLAPAPLEGGGMPDQPVPVGFEVASDEGFTDVVASGTVPAEPELGHSVHIDATGLTPDTWYWYRFTVGEHTSPVGRTRTLPAPDDLPDRFAFAFASCQNWQSGYYTGYPHLVEEELDAVVFLGDYIYEGGVDASAPRQHSSDEIITLDDYRERYALYRSDEGLRAAHAAVPWIVTWDDHEADNDYAGLTPEVGAPEVDFTERRAAAYQAYWEHMPLRLDPPEDESLRLHRSLDIGRLARLHVIDTRQHRDPQVCDDGSDLPVSPRCDEAFDPERTILGEEQRAWLVDGLTTSPTRWNVVANQVVFSDMPILGMYNMDQWDGYVADRAAVLEAMAAAEGPTLVVTGDIHLSGVGQLVANAGDPESTPVGMELVGTSISSSFPADFADIVESVAAEIPTIRYVNAHQRGYVVVTLTPDEVRGDYRLVDTVAEPTAGITTDASFAMGRDGVVREA